MVYFFQIRKNQKKGGYRYFKNKQTRSAIKTIFYNTLSDKQTPISTLTTLLARKDFAELISHFQGAKVTSKNSVYLEIKAEQTSQKYYCQLCRHQTPSQYNDKSSIGMTEVWVIEGADYKRLSDVLSSTFSKQ